jgi:hypothetical protein
VAWWPCRHDARQVAHQPTLETRHRKPMRPNPIAQYRLRVGELRVVVVKAVGIKLRRVYVGGKEVQLEDRRNG